MPEASGGWRHALLALALVGSAAGLTDPPFSSLSHPSADCPEAQPDCDLSDWSIPRVFCENDCVAEKKYCSEPVARWTYPASLLPWADGTVMGSCESIRCEVTDTVTGRVGRDGSGCTTDAQYQHCEDRCSNATRVCSQKCQRCQGDCLCACQAVVDTCQDMCEIKYADCKLYNAPVQCNFTQARLTHPDGGKACCDNEYHWCRVACDYTPKCKEGCWRSFTYGWQVRER